MDKVPSLRFKEFSGEWEEKKLGNISKIYDGTHQTPNYVEKGIPFFSVENITNNNFFNTKYVTEEAYTENNKKRKIEKNDILMTRIGSIGESKLVDWDIKADFYVSLALIKLNKNNCPSYINQFINSKFFQKELDKRTLKVAFPQKINLSDIGECLIKLPCFEEQEKIANFLSSVDKKISILEEKLNLFNQYKKGIMQKIFSQKLRFKDENGNNYPQWEEKKLGEVIEFLSDYTANGSFASLKENVTYYNEENYAVLVRTTDLEKNIFSPERFTDERGYNFLKKTALFGGEIILANVGSIGNVYKVPFYNKPMTLAPNTYVIYFNSLLNKEFAYQIMKTNTFKNKVLSKVGSSTLKAINKSNLREIDIIIPSSSKEQQKIADFLSAIDDKIENISDNLENLKLFKKSMLQKMFV